jgi:lipopolysaccharide/colanic/teichoic acid biosynthesis glycosyltransferase
LFGNAFAMNLARWLVAIRKLTGLSQDGAIKGLHPPEQLRRILARERARAHRSGDCLSVVTFALRGRAAARCRAGAWEREMAVLLATVLRGRLRSTDEAGWLDDRQIGVVLPGTSVPGARKVADDVCLQFPADVPPPAYTIYSYPPDLLPGEKGQGPIPAEQQGLPGQRVLGLELLFMQPLPVWKRLLDVSGAAVGLIILLPVFGAIAAAVKLSSPGPVFFRQWRSGRGGRPFVIYKFRTMVADAEARKAALQSLNEQDGPAFKVRADPRITAVGRLLRCTSLDELPQLWNVLKGDMSLVGPRPLPCEETAACEGWHRQRLDVVPGLTCLWQVKGRSTVSFAEWIRMDLQYIRSRSPWQDLKLLLLTVPAVILRRGAH